MSAYFKQAMSLVRRGLRQRGFQARAATFVCVEGGNELLLNIQRSQRSTAQRILATINVGVRSARLDRRLDDEGVPRDIWSAHWRARLSADGVETWLSLDTSTDPAIGANMLIAGAETVIPLLRAHATDEALRDLWAGGRSPGVTNYSRLLYLTVLCSEIGPPELAQSSLEELKALAVARGYEDQLQRALAPAGIAVSFDD